MRRIWVNLLGLLAFSAAKADNPVLIHTKQTFEFVAEAQLSRVAPLFGADRERLWAVGWAPRFVWPSSPTDREGMVFTVERNGRAEVWVNTAFDLDRGRIQYVYVVPERLVTRITLTLTPMDTHTRVSVTYERTALSPDANAKVDELARRDATSGPEWGAAVNAYLAHQ